MDAKLKALKVVDLKQILSKAQVSAPAKATKNDLIAKIQANKSALDVYAQLYPPDDLLAPPEEVDWNVDQLDSPPPQKQQKPPPVSAAPAPAPASAPAPVAAAAAVTPVPTVPVAASVDEELEKRRQRAARFGIPLVEPQQKKPRPAPSTSTAKPVVASVDPKVLEQRAARFGIKPTKSTVPVSVEPTNGKKRPAPQAQELDPEELERRKKRAERFGIAANKA